MSRGALASARPLCTVGRLAGSDRCVAVVERVLVAVGFMRRVLRSPSLRASMTGMCKSFQSGLCEVGVRRSNPRCIQEREAIRSVTC